MADPLLPNPDNLGPEDSARWLTQQRKAAQFVALQDQEASPDDAARAQELSRSTGDDPSLIYGDLENYQKQHKAALTSALLDQNQYLRDYVTSHPLAGKVSNDDWGTLDAVSEKLYKYSVKSLLDEAFAGFKEGFGDQPMGSWLPINDPGMNRMLWSEMTAIGYPVEMAQRTFGGLIGAAHRAATQVQVHFGADEGKAEQRSRELAAMLEAEFGGLTGRHPVAEPTAQMIKKASETLRSAKPYLDVGEQPPVGVHEVWDQVYAEQAKLDAKALDELFREAQGSTTKERAPELFSDFIRQHTDAKIGIRADEVARLYGGKEPAPEDGLLGYIGDLRKQLDLGVASGGDVEVPLADWLAHTDPEVAKELHDHIRVRAGGMTLDEAKEMRPPEGQIVAPISAIEPHDVVRRSAALGNLEAGAVKSIIPETAQEGTVAYGDVADRGLQFDAKDALGRVTLEELTGVPKALHEFLGNRLEAMAGDTPVWVVTPETLSEIAAQEGHSRNAMGLYFSDQHAILLAEDVANGSLGQSTAVHVLYHELAHAATYREMEEFPELKNTVRQMMHDVSAYHGRSGVRVRRGVDAKEGLPGELYRFSYGMKNEHEFIAEAFGNPKFQQLLSDTPISKELSAKLSLDKSIQSVWDAVRNIIKDLITKLTGVKPPDSIMDGLLRLGPVFEEAQRRLQGKAKGTSAVEAPIVQFKRDAKEIESKLTKLEDGYTRLWRADRPGEAGTAFTNDLPGIALPFRKAYGGGLRYVDIPTIDLPRYENRAGTATGAEFNLPQDKVAHATAAIEGKTSLADRELFAKANAIGMTVSQYRRYQDLIAKRAAEDEAFQKGRAEKEEGLRQRKEWKENEASVKAEVAEDLKSRPDIAADRFLREGHLYGDKVKRVRLDQSKLTDEQKASLSPEHYGPSGASPDDVAGLFGYQSGNSLISHLGRLHAEREQEGLTPSAHFDRVAGVETEREMKKRYGDLEQNVLEAAKDHVIGQTQLDMLHEEMVALAAKGGGEISFEKEQLKSWVKQQFNETTLGTISTDKFLGSAGRAGREAELALLEERPGDAFKAKQSQYISMLLANEAKRLEKERKAFDRIAKRFSRREVSGLPPEYTNWVHDILLRTGNPIRRSIQDLQDAIARSTPDSFEKFVAEKNASVFPDDPNFPVEGQVMPIADFLFDPQWGRWEKPKKLDQMNVDEFRAVLNSLKTLVKNGNDENKILVRGEKTDLAETIGKMVAQLETLGPGKEYPFGYKEKGVGHAIRTYLASLLQIESVFNRIDRGNPKGIFTSVITRSTSDGAYALSQLEKKYARQYRELPDFGDMKAKVDNPLFRDPAANWELRPMTRENMLAVLQNVGNPSNLDKLARGYSNKELGIKVEPQDILHWLFANTKKEDWDRAQKLGDIFKGAFAESAQMYHDLSGVAPEKVELQPIETPFGTYEGWYHPLIYDPLRPKSKKLMGPEPIEDGSYYRAATPSGYTKRRTGYAAPILLNFDAVPHRLQQILNDTAMRPSVTEVAKVFYDPQWKMAMTKYYGKEVSDLMLPWLKDIAGQKQYKDAAQTAAARALEYSRQNIIGTLIGFNPGTVMKHGPTAWMNSMKEVGPANFLRETLTLLAHDDETGERNWTFAFNNSQELPRRQRNWQETITGANLDLFKENTLRNWVIKAGATPVAISDLISAVPTWLAEYKSQIGKGEDHGEAIFQADRAVRRAHGSSATPSRPRIMRGGPLAQLATSFYTFFNDMFNRLYEMAWRAKDVLGQFKEGEYKAGLKEIPNLVAGLWTYVVWPALIEQAVSPIVTQKDSWGTWAAKVLTRELSSSLPVIRDMVEAFLGGRDPQIGLYSTGVQDLITSAKDIRDMKFNKAHAGKIIKHTTTSFGVLTGLTNAQEGRTGEFVYDYATGQTHPRNFGEVLRGLRYGTTKEFKR